MACISVDWFQCSFKLSSGRPFEVNLESKTGVFTLVQKHLRHNVFGKHFSIEKNYFGQFEQVAVFSYQPLSNILPDDLGHLKIINKFLYQDGQKLIDLVQLILFEMDATFHAISRFDIALDFKTFSNRRSVPMFFKQVVRGQWLKRRSCKLYLEGKTTRNLDIHYMRFGSNQTPMQFYVYNKSKEMREKTDKPYIRDKWKANKCDDVHSDTFRIEFVLHPSRNYLYDDNTGEAILLDSVEVLQNDFVQKLFWSLFDQHFSFVLNDGQVKKHRMKPVKFFNKEKSETVYKRLDMKVTSNRVDKMMVRKMYELNNDWRNQGQHISLQKAIENEVAVKGLGRWVIGKMLDGTIEQTVVRYKVHKA